MKENIKRFSSDHKIRKIFPHVVVFNYDIKSHLVVMKDEKIRLYEIGSWISENIGKYGDNWIAEDYSFKDLNLDTLVHRIVVYFKNEEDSVLFSLTWC